MLILIGLYTTSSIEIWVRNLYSESIFYTISLYNTVAYLDGESFDTSTEVNSFTRIPVGYLACEILGENRCHN